MDPRQRRELALDDHVANALDQLVMQRSPVQRDDGAIARHGDVAGNCGRHRELAVAFIVVDFSMVRWQSIFSMLHAAFSWILVQADTRIDMDGRARGVSRWTAL